VDDLQCAIAQRAPAEPGRLPGRISEGRGRGANHPHGVVAGVREVQAWPQPAAASLGSVRNSSPASGRKRPPEPIADNPSSAAAGTSDLTSRVSGVFPKDIERAVDATAHDHVVKGQC
jgi:hypothetical protein